MIISLSRVNKRYPGGYEALSGVSFGIEAGEMVFITGHSGAGKTTLLKLLPGIERATSGTLLINGQNSGIGELVQPSCNGCTGGTPLGLYYVDFSAVITDP